MSRSRTTPNPAARPLLALENEKNRDRIDQRSEQAAAANRDRAGEGVMYFGTLHGPLHHGQIEEKTKAGECGAKTWLQRLDQCGHYMIENLHHGCKCRHAT
jgi:hypothetical protein